MPYFVYAIHTDDTRNRLYDTFDDHHKATVLEKDMKAGNYPGDNYFVTMFYAENESEAEAIADAKRPRPKNSRSYATLRFVACFSSPRQFRCAQLAGSPRTLRRRWEDRHRERAR